MAAPCWEPNRSARRRIAAASSWPEPWQAANIVADGPSAALLRSEDLLPGPLIAVNCALSLRERLPVTIWATVDAPANLWKPMQPWVDDELLLMTTENNLSHWGKLLDVKRIYAVEPYYLRHPETDEIFRDGKSMKIMPPTMGFVLGWLWSMGVPHVRVFGADMKGQNTPFHPFLDFDPEDNEDTRLRWKAERVLFAEAVRYFRRQGWRLERYPRPSRRPSA